MTRPLLASRTQLVALRREAQEAGDGRAARMCTLALEDGGAALDWCTAVIVESLANDELGLSAVAAFADLLGLQWAWVGDRVHIRTESWDICAFSDCWQAKSRDSWNGRSESESGAACLIRHCSELEQSGVWCVVSDIEDTLRALGGFE